MKKIIVLMLATLAPAIAIPDTDNTAVIEQRQAAFKEIKAAVKDVKGAMKANDFQAANDSAATILTNAMLVTELFPEGSYEGDTRAKQKIWANWDDFQQRQQQFVSDAQQLVTSSESNDAGQLKNAFKLASKNCKGCHWKYRQVF
jgi:cytochrome c556